ncbi:UGSC family (seleno)protein [Halobellus salinisoli]|uniref:UGSC family (seleno)protein n=1 Tax=Halobellus salinisoli TaxID=3108500 RepID=UPI0030085476
MDIKNPLGATASGDPSELHALSPRIDELHGKHVGLYDNAKLAAEPVLEVLRERIDELYDDITFSYYSMEHLNYAKDPEKLDEVREWARTEDLDACIAAIGDCGSCTKFLVWGVAAIEDAGVPTVGLVDPGFELDYQSNAVERQWPLRYNTKAVRSEVRDKDRIAERLTPEVLESIEAELTRPLSEKEQGVSPE